MSGPTIKYVGIYCAFAATAIALTATLGLGSDNQQATSMNDTTATPTTTLTPLTTLTPPSTLDAPPALSAPPAPPLP
ncbi:MULTISPECIES: hypothetical protein [unclassified Mycobacterium]|uniref:hypothetical protein n=1 Tax=unclassified Mycobacterium TaxID=2642494 RepID=UPI000FB14F45|nr:MULTISPECIES: hypothetical protein [unclassified Mycobacterium]MDP7705899.1 hypothetical protein [Mycobacterium sp. TY815]MDP7725373.1 hypothetical protein [Mycobacterium sp. TY814]RUP04579.1 MAG: hypothetical protein EKK34_14000 [Mycobacterium sp.]